jgi:hypothetical protein
MKPARGAIDPEDYILSVLSPEDMLDAAIEAMAFCHVP